MPWTCVSRPSEIPVLESIALRYTMSESAGLSTRTGSVQGPKQPVHTGVMQRRGGRTVSVRHGGPSVRPLAVGVLSLPLLRRTRAGSDGPAQLNLPSVRTSRRAQQTSMQVSRCRHYRVLCGRHSKVVRRAARCSLMDVQARATQSACGLDAA